VADAIRVVQKWAFKPPTIKGKPAIVYAGRPVRFLTEAEARKAMAH
jgi:outer membrane biosynthesis protein TonB